MDLSGEHKMSNYQQLTDAYALNTNALFTYRVDARDALRGVRDAVLRHLDLAEPQSDMVRITTDNGESVFPLLAKLEHGESVGFNVTISVGGGDGLPISNLFVPATLSGKAGDIRLKIPSINFERNMTHQADYQEVAELLFDGLVKKLKDF